LFYLAAKRAPLLQPEAPAALFISSRTSTPYLDALDNADQVFEPVVSL
jgi:hypothetical protein